MKKYAQIINFNIVFGEDEKPMLDFFDTVIYPAFTSDIKKVSDDNIYLFKNVKVSEGYDNILFLSGQFVKKTILEIKSDINENGELVEKDERHSAAPYSTFVVNLMNHRMVYVPNQKGSPTISNFRSTVKYIISKYISNVNANSNEEDKISYPSINIVGIPNTKTINEILQEVDKINKLTLRFYPLNGDLQFSEVFDFITKDMRQDVGSKNGEIVFKSPKSVEGVKSIVEKAGGTINPILQVTTKDKRKITLKDYELSEKYEMDFDEDSDLEDERYHIINNMRNIDIVNFTNDSHKKIYERNRAKIIPFIKNRR